MIEVKGGLNGNAKGLSKEQAKGPHYIGVSRINLAANAASGSVWDVKNMAYGTNEFAQYVRREMIGQRYDGFVVQHNGMRTGKTNVRSRLW